MIQRLLLERLSLAGSCRVMNVSLRRLLTFIEQLYEALPADLNVRWPTYPDGPLELCCLEAEADERWSFVQSKDNKQWVWLAWTYARGKSSPASLEIVRGKVRGSYGSSFPQSTARGRPFAPTPGTPIRK